MSDDDVPVATPLAVSPDIEWAYLAPEALVYDASHQRVAHLNGTASSIWLLLIDGIRTKDEVIAELSEMYEVDGSRIRPDVEAALADFAKRGLLATSP